MKKNKNNQMILLIFLLGIFMGAMDNGIVSPARQIIQNGFGVDQNLGIWMITIYTLAFAIAMPIVSKLSDKFGYRQIYIFGITTFGLGSLLCGLTSFTDNFVLFLIARVIQAIGAGGIIPIATSVIGKSFPKEKEGMALGLVGAIYGIATILGPTIGSFVLNLAGTTNWYWLFFINVPISITIILLSNNIPKLKVKEDNKPIDFKGAILLAIVIGSLMYALTNIDFFNLVNSVKTIDVYPWLIIFGIFLPILILVEKKSSDPMLSIKYFKNKQMILIFILSFVVGIGMMGMIFIPQFAENILKIQAGTGGYVVTLLALFSGIAAPISGNLIDKKGPKFVLSIGFIFTILGTLSMAFLAPYFLNFISLLPGLILMGVGVGFTIGAPLNYLVLRNVKEEESATAIATMSLMRSIGVTISPSIMVGFIINASKSLQTNLMANINMPNITNITNSNAFGRLSTADVTTIVDKIKETINAFVPSYLQTNISNMIEGSRQIIEKTFQSTINEGYANIYITSAIVAAIGLLITYLLKKQKVNN
jgi:EmrB/QacA subfamily drug resistance transporter